MPNPPQQSSAPEAPLYIRWGPDKSPYAIELKLDLVERIRHALVEAAPRGLEIGGVLVGLLPTPQVPTLRIEDIEFLSRRSEDGATFVLEGGGERFAEIRRRARTRERTTVGLFRSHLRPGALRPSLADRTLLASEFKEPVYALFLASGAEPFSAAFFVASNGPLPAELSVREFKMDPAEFRVLPEFEPEVSRPITYGSEPGARSGAGTILAVVLILCAVLGVVYYFNQSLFPGVAGRSKEIDLRARNENGMVRISWNRAARELDQSQGGLLQLEPESGSAAAGQPRQIRLGIDELRLGSVVFEPAADRVKVTLAVQGPNASGDGHSAIWTK